MALHFLDVDMSGWEFWLKLFNFEFSIPLDQIRVRPGVGSGCSLRGADFLQILDGAANDSIISEHWAGEHTKTSDSYSPEPRAQPRGSKYRQIQTPSPSRSCCLTLWRKQIKRWRPINRILHLAFAANTILPSVPNVAPMSRRPCAAVYVLSGLGLGGIGLKLMLCPIIRMC